MGSLMPINSNPEFESLKEATNLLFPLETAIGPISFLISSLFAGWNTKIHVTLALLDVEFSYTLTHTVYSSG